MIRSRTGWAIARSAALSPPAPASPKYMLDSLGVRGSTVQHLFGSGKLHEEAAFSLGLLTSRYLAHSERSTMTDFNPESLASIGPKEFAQLVKTTPDSKIAEVMAGDSRGKILDEVF